ncbi:hypothetical protein SRA_02646 [Streptococcus ratti FA-1 = DSM 20564]|uniref:Uncharacterized protein n=1 Tax=Streptococcus ratti FA-1 = DSM 20564 TaxID=699248 RepID=A0ABP2R086_STRRT|nr:hypothetical protein SRA_02646 [Streptococcus ratti FA-1 = DSM 20564]
MAWSKALVNKDDLNYLKEMGQIALMAAQLLTVIFSTKFPIIYRRLACHF